MYLLDFAIEVAGRAVELLAFPLVEVHPDGVAVGAVTLRVNGNECLDVIIAGGDIGEALGRVTERRAVNYRRVAGLELDDVGAEQRRRVAPETSLQARFRPSSVRDHHEDAAGDRLGVS